ncbi:MAG: nucleoside 2-deoxyribosyltransferase [Methanoregulaceae archaeon]|nr:nucleoside 2-deoxyribosyltransferase [Methanoregulaceae archaeon]
MYVMICPCIGDPSLRARGITSQAEIKVFESAFSRCRHFGIETVSLPCPETRYLGKDREPGTFLERLNTPDFSRILEGLVLEVQEIIADRGPPLGIIGVDSSPTCGVTRSYYGGSPPKRPGRGVFLEKFPEIPAFDVAAFARYHVYLAAPLFSEAERAYNLKVRGLLNSHLFEVYLPQTVGDDRACRESSANQSIYEQHLQVLGRVDFVVAIIDGADADSGTAWEMGYASALGVPVIALRTDFRIAGHHERVNLMLERSSTLVQRMEELPEALGSPFQSGDPVFSH